MPSIGTLEGIASLVNYVTGGTTSLANAANNLAAAENAKQFSIEQVTSAVSVGADLGSLGAGSLQMLPQFSTASTERAGRRSRLQSVRMRALSWSIVVELPACESGQFLG